MLTKVMLGVIAAALVIVTIAALQVSGNSTAVAPAGEQTVAAARFTGADWYERHRFVATVDPAIYAGSDWYERHQPVVAPNRFQGSDWHERHPTLAAQAVWLADPDRFERHLSR